MEKENTKNPLLTFLNKTYTYAFKYKKEVLIGSAVLVGLITLLIGYGFYKKGLQSKAQKDLTQALKYFDMPVKTDFDKKEDTFNKKFFISEKEKWTKIADVFGDAYQKNKGAGIAPMFLAYQSEALANLGKYSQAIDTLKKSLGMMKSSSETHLYYKTKLALIQIDSKNPKLKKDGLQILKKLSLNQQSAGHDMVLYRLGEYFWYEKNYNEAKNYWNQLVLKFGKNAEKPSWWASLAKPKLKLISSK